MPIMVQIALTAGPLAAYLLILGAWQGGRDPKVVPGPVDFGFLVFGLGGLVAFGPVGKVLIGLLFPAPSLWAWLALPTSIAFGALLWAPRTRRRLVIYNIDRAGLERSLGNAIGEGPGPGRFTRTLRGFEDRKSARGLTLEASDRGRTGVVEAFGDRPEELIAEVAPALREALRGAGLRQSPISRLWFVLAIVAVWGPLFFLLMTRDPIRSAWRSWIGRFFGR